MALCDMQHNELARLIKLPTVRVDGAVLKALAADQADILIILTLIGIALLYVGERSLPVQIRWISHVQTPLIIVCQICRQNNLTSIRCQGALCYVLWVLGDSVTDSSEGRACGTAEIIPVQIKRGVLLWLIKDSLGLSVAEVQEETQVCVGMSIAKTVPSAGANWNTRPSDDRQRVISAASRRQPISFAHRVTMYVTPAMGGA